MKKNGSNKMLLCLLLTCLLIAAAWMGVSCKAEKEEGAETTENAQTAQIVGQGATSFTFEVVHSSGEKKTFTVQTDKTIVGEALQEIGLISGEDGAYGLYVKTVDGETLDYDTHKKYWAFYENDAYAVTGVDVTEINPDTVYAFRASE